MVVVSAPSNTERPGADAADGSTENDPDRLGDVVEVVTEADPDGIAGRSVPAPDGAQVPVAVPERERSMPERERSVAGVVPRTLAAALLVFGVVVGGVLLIPRPNAVPLQLVDVATAARAAAPELGFSPSVPDGPPGWTATAAVLRHGSSGIATWHVGFLTARGTYAGIEQATRSTFTWENALDSGGTKVGTVDVDGMTWDHMEKAERDTTSLILRRPDRVTLITAKGGGLADALTLVRSLPPGTAS
jgi:hypothetical protein